MDGKDNGRRALSKTSSIASKNKDVKKTVDRGQQTSNYKSNIRDFRMHYEGSVSSNSVEDIRAKAARSTNEMEQHLDFDDLLPEIGEFGCFQKVLFVLMIPFCYISAFVYLSQIFMTLPPDKYYCFVNELSLIASEEERKQLSIPKEADGSYSRCQMYDVNYTAVFKSKNRSELINSSLPLIPCREGYVFDRNEPFRTATMEFGWVCANDRYATYAQVIFFLGSVAGCLAYGHFADHCGRVAALVSSCSLAFFGSIFTSMATDFVSFVIIRLIVGASFDTCFTMIYILVLEYVGPTYRTFVGNMSLAMFYSPFTMLIPWMALLLRTWGNFALFGSIPIAFALCAYCYLPESARWLVSVGKIDNAIDILKNVAARNKRTVSKSYWKKFYENCELFYKEEFEGRSFTVFSIFKRRRLARYMVLMVFIWMTMSLIYDGHVRAASVLDKENVVVVFTIACATELPGDLLVIVTLDRFGRRWCAFTFTTLSGVFSLLAANLKNPTHTLVAALAGRFFANVCYNIGLQWAAEVLPTVVRAQGVAFIHTMGFVAMLLSPPVIYLSNVSLSLMLNTLGLLGILGGILSLFLPETLHQDLPQTLSDGDDFGKDQRMWHQPCCGPGARRTQRFKRNWHEGSSLRTLSRDEFRSKKMHRVAVVRPHASSFITRMPSLVSQGTEVLERIEKYTPHDGLKRNKK
ncbi:organic cation transporter protein-like isoform X2 [Drosophila novamexicana]|uniref:organic cation transporter protein-like isoform X2 n=1 Tax=Drosophila novamexicana TaxID=47314 RepID=UPI0011E5A75E|nr:organic cation transporter protein-like isoform X2 [Drosophila novamexicana]